VIYNQTNRNHQCQLNLNGQREGAGPLGNLLAESEDLRNSLGGNLGLEVLELVGLLGELSLDALADLDGLVNVLSNALEFFLAHATGGHGGGANTDTAGGEGGLVTGDGVLVAGNVDLLQNSLNTGTVQGLLTEVNKDHVAVSTISNELVAQVPGLVLERLGVLDNLLLVLLELRAGSLLEGNSKGSDGVVVGASLVTGEDREVDGTLKVIQDVLTGLGVGAADTLAEENHGTTGTTERLVGSGGDDISVLEGRRDDTSSNETRDVGHVDNEVGADLVSDLTHAGVVDQTAVGRGTGNNALGAVELSVVLKHVVVNETSLEVDTVGESLEVGGDSRDPKTRQVSNWPFLYIRAWTINVLLGGSLVTVTQVTTVGQVKTHEAVVRAHEGLVDLEVGRATRETLDVDTPLLRVEVESLESTSLAGKLNGIDVLVTTIVTSSGVTLRVLV